MSRGLVASIATRLGPQVTKALSTHPDGLTDFELAAELDAYLSSINATRNTLMNEGRVVPTGIRRPSGRGGTAMVWKLVA